MKPNEFLTELASLDHFPADFDPSFFNEIAERFFLSDSSFDVNNLVKYIVHHGESIKQPTILWSVLLAVLKRLDGDEQVVKIFDEWYKLWIDLATNCPCTQKLFFELATELVQKKRLEIDIVQEVSQVAVTLILAEQTNVDLRRCLSTFLASVLNNFVNLDEIVAKPLIHGLHQTDQAMVIDAVSRTLSGSNYLGRMTDAEKLLIHERLKGMPRPGRSYLELTAKIYLSHPETLEARLSEQFIHDKVPALVAYELLKFENSSVPKDLLLKLIAAHSTETIDYLIDCIEDYEESFPQEVDQIRREVSRSLSNPRHCSSESLAKFLNHLRLSEGISSRNFVQAFTAASSRIQRDPELLDAILVDAEDLSALMQESIAQKILHDLTIQVLMAEHNFNWIHVDSAIAILDRIGDYFHYDETQINERINRLLGENRDESGYVFLTAAKFILRRAPEYVLSSVDDLFVLNSNTDLRMAILNRLILCSDSELPAKASLCRILDDVVQLETSEQIQSQALNLAEKLSIVDNDYQMRVVELKKLMEAHEARRRKTNGYNVDDLVQIVQSVKVNSDCYNAEVSKECY